MMLCSRFTVAKSIPLRFIALNSSGLGRRSYSKVKNEIAFVFDIDGVLLRGKKPIPNASQALKLLDRHQIPYILLTNGGGVSESKRIEFISSQLGIDLSPLQIVQSHTPMKALAQNHQYDRVLVIGPSTAREAAIDYGFKDVVMPVDIFKKNPAVSPHHRYTPEDLASGQDVDLSKPIEAILVFNDPRDMNSDLQVVMDILNSRDGMVGTMRNVTKVSDPQNPAVPIIFSNNDLLWANDYPLPRFGQGAFRITVENLYRQMNRLQPHENLVSTILGKPYKIQYDYAHHVLIDWRNKLQNGSKLHGTEIASQLQYRDQILPPIGQSPENSPFDKIYMVGDNPESDIIGANKNGWESVLLRTGVYKDADWDNIAGKPTVGVFDDVLQSVHHCLKENNY
jgi:HAD superfamily hydrolase (TIGR01456 family)